MSFKPLRKIFPVATAILTTLVMLVPHPVNAAAVAVTVTTPTNAEFAALTATDVTFGYKPSSTQFSSGNTIDVYVSPALPGALVACATPTTDADGDATPDGSFGSYTTTGAVYTFSASTTTAVADGIDLCLKFPASTTAGMYSIAVVDSNDDDYGAALVYVGDDNDVTVTAKVVPLLSFAIRNSADTTDTNACPLGTLVLASVNTCAYRLKPATNASSGYTVQITTDGDLSRSTPGLVADEYDIDPITEGNTVTAGTEGYGIALNGGASSKGSITESGDFNDDDTPLPTSATNLYQSSGPNAPASTDTTNTALVTHRAAMDGLTYTGNYTQIVTFYVSASF